jgi:hypothetical protein
MLYIVLALKGKDKDKHKDKHKDKDNCKDKDNYMKGQLKTKRKFLKQRFDKHKDIIYHDVHVHVYVVYIVFVFVYM